MTVARLLRSRRAASAIEFALVAPLLIFLLFGVIDGGRWLWEVNRSEKATQAGARFAVVTDPVTSGLVTADYMGVGGLTQGDVIPKSAFGKVVCGSGGCCSGNLTCTSPYPALGTFDSSAFQRIVDRMAAMNPEITAANVRISYAGSGLGYAGDPDPNRMDVSPLVTVELTGLQFRPLFLASMAGFTMPSFATTLTAEDSDGNQSN
jgi:hypothetical protein